MAFILVSTFFYTELFVQLSRFEQLRVERFYDQLVESGDHVGKPLSGYSFFREKKFNGKRLYYLVYSDMHAILLVGLSDKKKQNDMIQKIKLEFDAHRLFVVHYLRTNLLI